MIILNERSNCVDSKAISELFSHTRNTQQTHSRRAKSRHCGFSMYASRSSPVEVILLGVAIKNGTLGLTRLPGSNYQKKESKEPSRSTSPVIRPEGVVGGVISSAMSLRHSRKPPPCAQVTTHPLQQTQTTHTISIRSLHFKPRQITAQIRTC
jgi:hypothetical protein